MRNSTSLDRRRAPASPERSSPSVHSSCSWPVNRAGARPPTRARAPVRQLFAGPSTSATACSRRRAPYRSLGNVRWWMGFCDVDLSSAQSWSPREVAEIPMRQQEQVPASHGHRTRSGCSTPQAVALRAWLFSMESRSVVSVGGHCSFTWRSRWPLWSGGRLPTRPKRYDALAGNELARPRRALLLA